MTDRSRPSPRGASTRDALIEAATLVFARERFGSANLREIAQIARVNPALIGYHFQNKEGLYLAVFERMLGRIRSAMDPALADLEACLAAPPGRPGNSCWSRSCASWRPCSGTWCTSTRPGAN